MQVKKVNTHSIVSFIHTVKFKMVQYFAFFPYLFSFVVLNSET